MEGSILTPDLEENRKKLRRGCRDKAGPSPLPHYVPDDEKGYGLRVTRPNPQFMKPRKEKPLIPGYEPGGDDGT